MRTLMRLMVNSNYLARLRNLIPHLTPDEIEAGRRWYRDANSYAKSIYPSDVNRGAAIIAALSPRVAWQTNLESASIIARASQHSDIIPTVAGTYANTNKAWRIAKGQDILSNLNQSYGAYKVNNFYRNITLDFQPVTIDVWAARAVGYERDVIRGLKYLEIERAYQDAARRYTSLEPAELQAAIWIHTRGSAA
jgi:hypothetical protein